ncbi:MAG: hypothetical protein JNL60_00070 [Bacteroidia bacterium]|nr:hypothetical protein [Bacteroidia bacterium]
MFNFRELLRQAINAEQEILPEYSFFVFKSNQNKFIIVFKTLAVLLVKLKFMIFVWKKGFKIIVETNVF